ncbi:M48 family metalloprotease [Candidatus Woesearchaeota archaeon]|nr:M48 family metalloprotease [Candidatus Woesearchaeota archaeon]MCF7901410.1 M48 family metalloprotease [Candidatus Woesearchaeota archaeon]MCF8012977.1 M48 family metalloprotease [Candidatus Woesearchaeota archaeon]
MNEKRINFNEIRNNNFKSILLFFMFAILIAILGSILGIVLIGNIYFGLILASIFLIIYSLISWFAGANMIMGLTGAKPATKQEYPHLYHTVEGLALAAGLPTPKTYVIKDSALNAFATGRDPKNSAIAVTTGLLETMNREELEGVIAHEMSHIKNYDIRAMMIATIMTGVIILLGDVMIRSFLFGGSGRKSEGNMWIIIIAILLAILSPIIAQMIKLAISRKREYAADAGGAVLTRYPPGLASALKKIAKDPDPLVDKANRATAHLFISTPFRKKKGFMTGLFATHPPIEERIKRLEQM